MDAERVPIDLAAYEQRIRTGRCFVCGVVAGDPTYDHEQVLFEDDAHIAFLDRYPTLHGKVLVMLEGGVIPWSPLQAAALAAELRAALQQQ